MHMENGILDLHPKDMCWHQCLFQLFKGLFIVIYPLEYNTESTQRSGYFTIHIDESLVVVVAMAHKNLYSFWIIRSWQFKMITICISGYIIFGLCPKFFLASTYLYLWGLRHMRYTQHYRKKILRYSICCSVSIECTQTLSMKILKIV